MPSSESASTNAVERLYKIMDNIIDGGDAGEELRSRVALSMAKAEAIAPGCHLDAAEREHLLGQLFRLATPNYTPDGKLIVSIVPIEQLTSLF